MTLRIAGRGRQRAELWAQKAQLSLDLFAKNELGVQAAAAAYYFLLSAAPLLLVVIATMDVVAARHPGIGSAISLLLGPLGDGLGGGVIAGVGSLGVRPRALGVLGVASLLWGSRLVFSAIQRALGVVFPSNQPRSPVLVGVVSLLLVPLLLVGLVAGALVVAWLGTFATGAVGRALIAVVMRTAPGVVMFAAAFCAYRFLAAAPPRTTSALQGAALAGGLTLAFGEISGLVFHAGSYDIVSRAFGSSILLLVTVYFAVMIFYVGAEVAYVSDSIDALLVERMNGLGRGRTNRVERWLFREPRRILERFARTYQPGETIIKQGAQDRDVYYVYKGTVRVRKEVRGSIVRLHTMGSGEFFGEMSYLLNEPRTVDVVAEDECVLFVLPPALFEDLLHLSRGVSRDVIRALCVRLKASTVAEV